MQGLIKQTYKRECFTELISNAVYPNEHSVVMFFLDHEASRFFTDFFPFTSFAAPQFTDVDEEGI